MTPAILFRVALFFLFLILLMIVLILAADYVLGTKIMNMLTRLTTKKKMSEAEDFLDIEEARLQARKKITDKAKERSQKWKKEGLY